MGVREFRLFRELIHKETGIWLRDGKEVMLASRLSSRLRHHGIADFAAYYEFATHARDGTEMRELINRITTNKTSFFRENQHFEFLTRTVVPGRQQAASAGAARTIRVWSAASSTGEEAYSIAMTLLEALHQPAVLKTGWSIEVVASDIDTKVLETAAHGVYPSESLQSVPVLLRSKYFLRGRDDMEGKVKARKELRQLVTFKHINLTHAKWNVDGIFDAIFFRNALIYFTQQTQNDVLRRMLVYLKPKGYLFLGHSEHVPWLQDAVTPLRQTIYQLKDSGH
jgi:chemotaxis protein methyltransferase CheR